MWLTRQVKHPLEGLLDTFPQQIGESTYVHIPVSVLAKNNEVIVNAEIPGINKKDITIEFYKGNLVISGQKENATTRQTDDYLYSEFRFGSFKREVTVGEDVAFEDAKAQYTEGVLTVTLPKKENSKPQKLEIR